MQRYEHGGDVYTDRSIKLDFSINVNPMGMPPKAKQAIIDNINGYDIYPDTKCLKLTSAISKYHGIDENRILCGNGASDLIFRIAAWKSGCKALITAPTFSEYERAVCQYGGEVVEYPLTPENDFLLTEGILDVMTKGIGLMFLCSPNNPTGRMVPEFLFLKILKKAEELDIIVVLDECFLPFTKQKSMSVYLNDHLLILRAFTKIYGMAGVRLGYLLGTPANISRIKPFGSEWSVSTIAQVAGIAALEEEGWVEKTKQMICEERVRLIDAFEKMGLKVYAGEGNYILLKGPVNLHADLKKNGILVRSCDNYSGLGPEYIRIGIKDKENNTILINAMQEVLNG